MKRIARLGLAKVAEGVLIAALLVNGSATVSLAQISGADELTAQEIIGKSRDAYAALSSYKDTGTITSEMVGQKNTMSFKTRLQRPNLYRVDWEQNTKPIGMPGLKGTVWSDGSGDYLLSSGAGQERNAKPQKMQDMKSALGGAAGSTWSTSLAIPGTFFHKDFGDTFVLLIMSGHYPLKKEKDAKVGGVDCFVVSSVTDLAKTPETGKTGTSSTMLWIGKKDFLIHQCRTKYVHEVKPSAPPSEQEIDAAIRKTLEMQNNPATPEAIAAMRPQMRSIMKQTQTTIKASFESGIVNTRIHENIVVNENLAPATFNQ